MSPHDKIAAPGAFPHTLRITEDLCVEGLLRIADGCRIDGDVIAPGGLILGHDVVVHGDVYTDGQVQVGKGSSIQGTLHPVAQAPTGIETPIPVRSATSHTAAHGHQAAGAVASGMQAGPAPDPDQGRVHETVRTTVALLWDLLVRTPADQLVAAGRPTDLAPEALDELLDGLGHLLAQTYGTPAPAPFQAEDEEVVEDADALVDETGSGPWTAEDIVDVLCRRILPMILPVTVTRLDPTHARLDLQRPTPFPHGADPRGWGLRALILIDLLTGSLLPGATVESDGQPELLDPRADPDRVRATVRLGSPGAG